EDDNLDDPLDQRQVTDLGLDRRDRVEGALLRTLDADLGGHVGAHLAGGDRGAVADRDLARGEDEVAGPDRRDVGGDRLGDLGHAQAELGQTRLGVDLVAGHQSSCGRFRKATRPPWALAWMATSSHPSAPKLLSMSASLWSGMGATWYCHFVFG